MGRKPNTVGQTTAVRTPTSRSAPRHKALPLLLLQHHPCHYACDPLCGPPLSDSGKRSPLLGLGPRSLGRHSAWLWINHSGSIATLTTKVTPAGTFFNNPSAAYAPITHENQSAIRKPALHRNQHLVRRDPHNWVVPCRRNAAAPTVGQTPITFRHGALESPTQHHPVISRSSHNPFLGRGNRITNPPNPYTCLPRLCSNVSSTSK